MPTFSNLNDMMKYVKKKMQESMEDEVGKAIKETMQNHIQKDVYSYTPKRYIRHEEDGGLIADENIEVRSINDGIEVENVTEHDGKYIPAIIESGRGYTYTGYGYDYENPRPFVQNTKKTLKKDKIVLEALKKGLKERGIKATD